MCGITLNKTGLVSTRHRGLGTKTQPIGDYFLSHDWLPIQTQMGKDPQQPIQLDDGSWMAYNGEIFDYPKEVFENDTDYLVHLINAMGFKRAMVELGTEHDGFWSVVTVTKEGKVQFATDPLGKKQLYIDHVNKELCSELRGLRPRAVSDRAILDVIRNGYTDRPLFNGMSQTIHGTIYEDFQPTVRVQPKPEPTNIVDAMQEAVQNRLIGHENIAVCVSAGLDSTIVAYHLKGIMEVFSPGKIKLYTTYNMQDDEYIKPLEDFLKIPVKRIPPDQVDPLVLMDSALMANETPFDLGSMIPQYLLFGSIPERVILTGDGADELFGGYRRNQYFPTFTMDLHELIYYHLPRLDRMAAWFTKESRQPFLSRRIYAHALAKKPRGKQELRQAYKDLLPGWVLDRSKHPLKSFQVRNDEKEHRFQLIERFLKFAGYEDKFNA